MEDGGEMDALSAVSNGDSDRDSLMLFGGVALLVLGAGLILSNRAVRGYLGGLNIAEMVGNAAPDIQRYFKLKSM
jgi:hypothetical protein